MSDLIDRTAAPRWRPTVIQGGGVELIEDAPVVAVNDEEVMGTTSNATVSATTDGRSKSEARKSINIIGGWLDHLDCLYGRVNDKDLAMQLSVIEAALAGIVFMHEPKGGRTA